MKGPVSRSSKPVPPRLPTYSRYSGTGVEEP